VTASLAHQITEQRARLPVPLWVHPEWSDRFPWLVQGTTGRGDAEEPWDFGLAGDQPVGEVLGRWRELRRVLGFDAAVHSRQVHKTEIRAQSETAQAGLLIVDGYDGHTTDQASVLLTVTVADCIPVFLVNPEPRVVSMLHAGWRGVAGGIVERGVRLLTSTYGSHTAELWLHCGPAICGACYEVGPEVHRAIRPAHTAPSGAAPIDLRAAVVDQATTLGIPSAQVTWSTHCSRCGPGGFFSHRAGSAGRQLGIVGVRAV
jgi:YfiH family protein